MLWIAIGAVCSEGVLAGRLRLQREACARAVGLPGFCQRLEFFCRGGKADPRLRFVSALIELDALALAFRGQEGGPERR